jgi:integrase
MDVTGLLKAQRSKLRYRKQTGSIIERTDGFYIRFYKDIDGVRTRVIERLCDLDTDSHTRELMAESHMSAINHQRHAALHSTAPAPITVGTFWEQTYRPWVIANKRSSTLRGYDYDWKLYIKREIAHREINSYTTVDACELLDRMVSNHDLNKKTLAHVKSLCSGIFTIAVRKGIITINPWREAKESVKVRESSPRIEYTPEETNAILTAIQRTDAKLFFALCSVMGMRPSEAAAARWENIGDGVLHVLEAAPYGKLGELKTKRSKRDLTITEPVTSLLKTHHKDRDNPAEGWLFTHDGVKPINHNTFAKSYIVPFGRKACARWNGCYSGRHGAATTLFNLTGDARAAYQVLGNSLAVVQKEYIKPSVAQGQAGQKLYAKQLLKVSKRAKRKEQAQ